jgi:hypothetical protein
LLEQHQSVVPDIALGVEFGRLLDSVEAVDFGQDLLEQAGAVEQFKGAAGAALGQHAGEFVANTLKADLMDLAGASTDGGFGSGVDFKVKTGGEADGAQHAELIFVEALGGVSDGADDAGVEVGAALDKIEDLAGLGIEEHSVDGEVAA